MTIILINLLLINFYSFASWDQVIPEVMPANNMTIKASWNLNSYTITLHPNGGTVENTLLTFAYNSTISLPVPTKDGVSFVGWFTDDGFDCEWRVGLVQRSPHGARAILAANSLGVRSASELCGRASL